MEWGLLSSTLILLFLYLAFSLLRRRVKISDIIIIFCVTFPIIRAFQLIKMMWLKYAWDCWQRSFSSWEIFYCLRAWKPRKKIHVALTKFDASSYMFTENFTTNLKKTHKILKTNSRLNYVSAFASFSFSSFFLDCKKKFVYSRWVSEISSLVLC